MLYLSALRDVRRKTAGDVHQTTIVRAHHCEERIDEDGASKLNRWQRETRVPYQQGPALDVTEPPSVHTY
jgi:hypothetical protein